MRVSVVIPTHRRPALLARCLGALQSQSLASSDYEIIVVDDGDDASTRAVVAHFASPECPRMRYECLGRRQGPAAARNRGWQKAEADIVAFTDDDTVPAPDWLAQGLRAFTLDVEAVWGRVVVPVPADPTDYERDAGRLAEAEAVTANCFYRRGTLARLGGFDERFKLAWREDSDLYFSLLAHRGHAARAFDAVVTHPLRPARWGVSLAQQRKNIFNALLYKKHRRLYRERIQAAPPWRYYAIVLTLVVALLAAGMRQDAVLAAAFATWALLTAGFCRHRLARTSHAAAHVLEMIVTSVLIPPLAVYWRLYGALKFRVFFI